MERMPEFRTSRRNGNGERCENLRVLSAGRVLTSRCNFDLK